MSIDRLGTLIASQESVVQSLEESVKTADEEQLFQEEAFDDIYENAIMRYKTWEIYLQRPPYSEKIDYNRLFRMSKTDEADSDSHAKDIPDIEADLSESKFTQLIKAVYSLKKLLYRALYLAYPAEVYFAAPAFLYITPVEIFGYAGAILQVGSLGVMGWISACLLMRCRENRIFDAEGKEVGEQNQPKPLATAKAQKSRAKETTISEHLKTLQESGLKLKWKLNFRNMLYLLIAVVISLVIIFSATAMRSMIYDLTEQQAKIDALIAEKDQLEDKLGSTPFSNTVEIKRLQKQIDETDKALAAEYNTSDKIHVKNWLPTTTDGYSALSLYLSLYFAQIFAKLLQADPYWEYTQAAHELNRLCDMRRSRELAKYLFVKGKKNKCELAKSELKMMQKALELAQARHDKAQDEIKKLSNSQEGQRFIDAMKCWQAERMLNYFGMYMLLRGSSIKQLGYDKDVKI